MISQRNSFFDKLNLNVVAIAVAATAWALPAVSPVFVGLQIFAPLPAFYFLVELGQRRGLTTLAAALLISGMVSVLLSQSGVFMFTTLMLPAGLIMAKEVLNKQSSPVRTGFKALLVLVLVWLLWALFYGVGRPGSTGIYGDIVTSLDAGLVEVGATLKGNTSLEPEQALEVEAAISRLRGLLPRVMPGLLFTTMLNTIFFNMVAGQYFLRRRKAELVPWPPFAAWRLPEPLVALVIVAGFCLLLPTQIFKDIGLNLLLVAGTLYFFQGLSLLTSLLNRWSVPGLLRALIFLLLLVQAYGIMLLAAFGLVDVWANLRKPRPKPEEDNI
jgi:uncharacterized protein YybS (DUF2232 family)